MYNELKMGPTEMYDGRPIAALFNIIDSKNVTVGYLSIDRSRFIISTDFEGEDVVASSPTLGLKNITESRSGDATTTNYTWDESIIYLLMGQAMIAIGEFSDGRYVFNYEQRAVHKRLINGKRLVSPCGMLFKFIWDIAMYLDAVNSDTRSFWLQ